MVNIWLGLLAARALFQAAAGCHGLHGLSFERNTVRPEFSLENKVLCQNFGQKRGNISAISLLPPFM